MSRRTVRKLSTERLLPPIPDITAGEERLLGPLCHLEWEWLSARRLVMVGVGAAGERTGVEDRSALTGTTTFPAATHLPIGTRDTTKETWALTEMAASIEMAALIDP